MFTRARTARPVLAMAFAPTLVTVVLEAVGLWGPSNMTRAIAALPAGAAVALVVMNALGYTTFNARGRG